MSEPTLRIGTSGYQYDHWQGVFYPEDLPKKSWFGHYADHFDTVEVNNTFYHLPTADAFDAWHDAAPPGFRYALKFSRYGSHLKHLKDPADTVQAFVERADRLKAYAGPILVQLPPKWNADPERLRAFLEAAPGRYRWAVELRDASWLDERIYGILEAHGAALCIHDMLADHPRRLTADWTYVRFHGDHYRGSYAEETLADWAEQLGAWLGDGKDAYVYFNNDEQGHAVHDALELRRRVLGAD